MEKKLKKILNLSQKNSQGVSSIAFNNEDVIAYGLGSNPIKPTTAIYYSNLDGSPELRGHINKSSIVHNNKSESTIFAIDNRDTSKSTLYVSNKNKVGKINQKTNLSKEDLVILYWEYGPYTFFIFSTKDPFSKDTIVECIFSDQPATQKACRYLFLGLLPSQKAGLLIEKFQSSLIEPQLEVENDDQN